MQHAWERGDVYTTFLWGNLIEREHFEDPGLDGIITIRQTFRKYDGRASTGSMWLRIGAGGGHL